MFSFFLFFTTSSSLFFQLHFFCAASCFSLQVVPRLSTCQVFNRGSGGTLTVQGCRQARGEPHGWTSQTDFVLNLSPRCTRRTLVRLKCVKSITGRERRVSQSLYQVFFFFYVTCKSNEDRSIS